MASSPPKCSELHFKRLEAKKPKKKQEQTVIHKNLLTEVSEVKVEVKMEVNSLRSWKL